MAVQSTFKKPFKELPRISQANLTEWGINAAINPLVPDDVDRFI